MTQEIQSILKHLEKTGTIEQIGKRRICENNTDISDIINRHKFTKRELEAVKAYTSKIDLYMQRKEAEVRQDPNEKDYVERIAWSLGSTKVADAAGICGIAGFIGGMFSVNEIPVMFSNALVFCMYGSALGASFEALYAPVEKFLKLFRHDFEKDAEELVYARKEVLKVFEEEYNRLSKN